MAVPQPTNQLSPTHLASTWVPHPRHMSVAASGVGQPLPWDTPACIYLDYNATTPIFAEVADAMAPYLQRFGNPSSSHAYGRPCHQAVQAARGAVAAMLGCSLQEVYFCSCGSEADHWAIWGAVMAARRRRPGATPHVVTSAIEHPAVLEQLKQLQQLGLASFTAVGVTPQGLVPAANVEAAMTPDTVLVSVMHSNNEVGSLQPVGDIAAIAHRHGVLMHTDAAQSIGKVDVNVEALGVDMCTVVGHKFGAPKGVAALYIRDGVQLERLLSGGGQEQGRRAGTENVLLIAGLGRAAEIVCAELPATHQHMATLRDRLQSALLAGLPEGAVRINGPSDASLRLPNTLTISIKGLNAGALLQRLGDRLAASAGAACHSAGGAAVSGVLQAMQVPPEFAGGTLRLSVGRHTTPADVDAAAELIVQEWRGDCTL